MSEYLLFIDTEASDLPKNWTEPYSRENNWPFSVQTSWVICNRNGEEITRKDFYIEDIDFKISKSSLKIHGIDSDFLKIHGQKRATVMQKLFEDVMHYQPMIIGHFLEFDYHVLAADFYRAGIDNPIEKLQLPVFCTMLPTSVYVKNPHRKFMKLGELYEMLFHKSLIKPHNAIYDARATADCFFELLKRGELTEQVIVSQNLDLKIKPAKNLKKSWAFFSLLLLFILLIAFTI